MDKQELIIGDEDIAFMVAECTAVPSPKEPSIFMNKLQHIAEQNGYKINSAVWSWQSMASRMGNILEKVIKITASKTYENTNILYIRGDDLRHEIENIRSNGTPDQKRDLKKYLVDYCYFSPKYVDDLFAEPSKGQKRKPI